MKDKPENRTAVLKLKLGACLTGPTKRLAADLRDAARLFNRSQNRMVRYWERWCEDHPEAFDKPGDPKCKMSLPSSETKGDGSSFPNQLYHAGRQVSPQLNTAILAAASNEILPSHIKKAVPWNHEGEARRVWQAILWNETARPCFRQLAISCPSKTTRLTITTDRATLEFALWSKLAGRKVTSPKCRIEVRQMPRGLRSIVRKVAHGEDGFKLCGSELVFHEGKKRGDKGHWEFHMCYSRPPSAEKLNPANVARLVFQGGQESHPFKIEADTVFPWKLGDVVVLKAAHQRLEARRLAMRAKYRDAGSGSKGHGRGRIEESVRPHSRAMQMLAQRFMKNIVAQVVKFCRRYDCGTLAWEAPGMGRKAAGWFADGRLPFDWTRFQAQLEHRCWLHNITIASGGEG